MMYLQTNRVFLCFDERRRSFDDRDLLSRLGRRADESRPERLFEDGRRRE